MTQAVWPSAEPAAAPRLNLGEVALATGAVLMLLVYSQAWVFPLMGEEASASESGLIRALYLPAYAVGALLLALSPWDSVRAALRQPFLLALLALAALSVTWSIAPDQTMRRVFALYCTTLSGVVLAARCRWAELAEIVAACFAILALASLAAAVALPSIGRMDEIFPGAWRGLWSEKNALGGNMALGFTCLAAAAVLNPRRALLWGGFAVLAVLMVLASTSKTSLVALLLGFGGLVFVALARRGPIAGVTMVWVGLLGLGGLVAALLFASDVFLELLGKDATLTGRTQIWTAALRQIEQRPWTGFGYDVVWGGKGAWAPLAKITKEAGFTAQHAHNSWIEQWLGLGIFGLTAFGLLYLQTLALAAVSLFRHRGAYLAVPFLVIYSLLTLTESVAVTYNDLRWVLFVAVAVKLAWLDREQRV